MTQSKPLPLLLLVSHPLPILMDLPGNNKLFAFPKCSSLHAITCDPFTILAESKILFFIILCNDKSILPNNKVHYAIKANSNLRLLEIIKEYSGDSKIIRKILDKHISVCNH